MGKALVLKSVDFSSVAVDKVTIGDEVPCTAISIDQSSISIDTAEGTSQLTATATPANTTDVISWTSSEDNVASVSSEGLVTVHGIGEATITVSCGEQTASITITQTSLKAPYEMKKVSGKYISKNQDSSSGDNYVLAVGSIANQYAIGQAYHEGNTNLHLFAGKNNDIELVKVPYGATKAKIKTSDDVAVSISYTYVGDATELVDFNGGKYIKYIRDETFVSTSTGISVVYGEAVGFRPTSTQEPTLQYIYFT